MKKSSDLSFATAKRLLLGLLTWDVLRFALVPQLRIVTKSNIDSNFPQQAPIN
jgi:hypothetical protein